MSQVSGAKQTPPTPRPASLGWLPALVALIVSTIGFGFAAVSCSQGPDRYPGLDGGPSTTGGTPECIGATCPAACAAHPGPGCACTVPGQHLACGKVEATYPAEADSPAQTVCGEGFSVCTAGVWGECEITGSVIIVPNTPAGYYAQGLGTGSACVNNPCDPECKDFVDTPTGVNPGTGLQATDGGVTLSGGGAPPCVPKTCLSLGFTCGVQSDGCGNALNCGTCTFPQTCGGGGMPSVCGVSTTCTNLCLDQTKCAGNATTSISGTVYMPNGTTPLANVLVYVPNAPVAPFTTTVSCVSASNCDAEVSGSPLVATTSNVDGTFTLNNVPVNVAFPVVLQLGRFRRQFTMQPVTACMNTAVPCATPAACLTRFARSQNETSTVDNIPKMAFSTGYVDALECVWIKVGIDSTSNLYGTPTGEFTPGNSAGRINLYYGGGSNGGSGGGAFIGGYGTTAGNTPPFELTVLNHPTTVLNQYDIVLFPCGGAQIAWPSPNQVNWETNLANYANAGGRVFSTHFSYIWLYSDSTDLGAGCGLNGTGCGQASDCCSLNCNNGTCATSFTSSLSPALQWSINQTYSGADPTNGDINMTFPGGSTLANWLVVPAVVAPAAPAALGQMQINTIRHDFNGVNPPSEVWVTLPACYETTSDATNCGGLRQRVRRRHAGLLQRRLRRLVRRRPPHVRVELREREHGSPALRLLRQRLRGGPDVRRGELHLPEHDDGSEQLRRLRHQVPRRSALRRRHLRVRERHHELLGHVQDDEHGSEELRRVRHHVRRRPDLQRGRLRLPRRPHELLQRVHLDEHGPEELRRLQRRVPRRPDLHRGRLRLPRRPHELLQRVHHDGHGSEELRRLRHRVPGRPDVRRGRLRLPQRPHELLGHVHHDDHGSEQLRRLRHQVRLRLDLRRGRLRLPRRPDELLGHVHHVDHGSEQLRRVRRQVRRRPDVQRGASAPARPASRSVAVCAPRRPPIRTTAAPAAPCAPPARRAAAATAPAPPA